jgi:probable phosphoglycerate mutase
MIVALVRHGPTEWNEQRRIQGRRDLPLGPAGEARVRGWRLPGTLVPARWVSSPLARAVRTATLLSGRQPEIAEALVEMDWGPWEGFTLAELRARHGAAFAAVEARGLDFRAPGGESPREVQRRALQWLASAASQPGPVLAVTHKGVIRALLAAATGWDMLGKPPHRLLPDTAQLLRVGRDGTPGLLAANVPLDGRPSP